MTQAKNGENNFSPLHQPPGLITKTKIKVELWQKKRPNAIKRILLIPTENNRFFSDFFFDRKDAGLKTGLETSLKKPLF